MQKEKLLQLIQEYDNAFFKLEDKIESDLCVDLLKNFLNTTGLMQLPDDAEISYPSFCTHLLMWFDRVYISEILSYCFYQMAEIPAILLLDQTPKILNTKSPSYVLCRKKSDEDGQLIQWSLSYYLNGSLYQKNIPIGKITGLSKQLETFSELEIHDKEAMTALIKTSFRLIIDYHLNHPHVKSSSLFKEFRASQCEFTLPFIFNERNNLVTEDEIKEMLHLVSTLNLSVKAAVCLIEWKKKFIALGCNEDIVNHLITTSQNFKKLYLAVEKIDIKHRKSLTWELYCLDGNVSSIKAAIENKIVTFDKTNDIKANLMHYCALSGSVKVFKYISSEFEIDDAINAIDIEGKSVQDYAKQSGSIELIQELTLRTHNSECKKLTVSSGGSSILEKEKMTTNINNLIKFSIYTPLFIVQQGDSEFSELDDLGSTVCYEELVPRPFKSREF